MSEKVCITIDGQKISATKGEMLLWVALENNIYIPHLCAYREETENPPASCRLCFVEVEGRPAPVPACTLPVYEGMVINTRSEQVDTLVAAGFELIMSNHKLDCKNCSANGNCALQQIAKARKLRLKPQSLPMLDKNKPLDDSVAGLIYDPNKCVLCGQCIRACRRSGSGILGFTQRGFQRAVTTFGTLTLQESGCTNCKECVQACPVGAFSENL